MWLKSFIFIGVLSTCVTSQHPVPSSKWNSVEQKVSKFIDEAERELQEAANKQTFVEWDYATNINDENEAKRLDYQVIQLITYNFRKKTGHE